MKRIFVLFTLCVLAACQQTVSDSASVSELVKQADIARALGKDAKAMGLYEQAAAKSEGPIRAHLELAGMYDEAGRSEDAISILEEAYKLSPQNVEVLKGLAQQLLQNKRGGEAGRYLARALVQSPKDVRLISAYGVWLDQMGQHEDAQEYYRQAKEFSLTPQDELIAANNMALSLIASGKPEKAIAVLEGLPKKEKNSAAYRQVLALAYGVKGDEKKAKELCLKDMNAEKAEQNLAYYKRYRNGEIPKEALFKSQ